MDRSLIVTILPDSQYYRLSVINRMYKTTAETEKLVFTVEHLAGKMPDISHWSWSISKIKLRPSENWTLNAL